MREQKIFIKPKENLGPDQATDLNKNVKYRYPMIRIGKQKTSWIRHPAMKCISALK